MDIIDIMDGAVMAKKHSDILKTVSDFTLQFQNDYVICLKRMLVMQNDLASHYYWQRLTEERKIHILQWEYIKKIVYAADSAYSKSHCLLFLFTNSHRQQRIQLLQNEKCCFHLMDQLCNIRWFPILDACAMDILKNMTTDSIVILFNINVQRLNSTIAYRVKYVQICSMLLQIIRKDILQIFYPQIQVTY